MCAKVQLISKPLFGILNSSKKQTKKFDLTTTYVTSGRLVFVPFLEEFEDTKRHFCFDYEENFQLWAKVGLNTKCSTHRISS
jgi:hypothetical protein